jgi:glycosyltransferase involved in cell wall biosynthesis
MNISVVVPSHNNARLLARALAGFAVQEGYPAQWEIIIVDNNSDDESIATVHRQFRSRLPISLIQQPNLPHPFALCKARNTGIRLAKGEWIACIDADIIPNRQYLNSLVSLTRKWGNKSIIATGERKFISAEGVEPDDIIRDASLIEQLPLHASPSNYGLATDRRLPTMKQLPDVEHPWDYLHGCNVIYRREDALSIGGYQEAYDGQWGFEDIDFAYRMVRNTGCTPLYSPDLCVYHQDLPEDKPQMDRCDKNSNPNWARICAVIPGYKQYKMAKYRQLSDKIQI